MDRSRRTSLLEPLLAALETERHCRAPLLRTLLDEMSGHSDETREIAAARVSITSILDAVETKTIAEPSYRAALARTRALVDATIHGPRAA